MPSNAHANADRLFLNDGKGHFSLGNVDLPQHFWTKSCIAVADITGRHGDLRGLYRCEQGRLLPGIRGEIRDFKWLHTDKYGDVLVAARNNDSLTFFQYQP